MQSRVFVASVSLRLHLRLQHPPRPHLHLRLQVQLRVPQASQMSDFECSSLEGQMPGRRLSYKESAIQRRVQRSIDLACRVLANGYVLIAKGAFDLIVYPGYARRHNRGWMPTFLSATADNENSVDSVAITTLRMNSSSRITTDMFSMTPADLRREVKKS